MLQKKKPRNIANRETPRDDKFSDKTDELGFLMSDVDTSSAVAREQSRQSDERNRNLFRSLFPIPFLCSIRTTGCPSRRGQCRLDGARFAMLRGFFFCSDSFSLDVKLFVIFFAGGRGTVF